MLLSRKVTHSSDSTKSPASILHPSIAVRVPVDMLLAATVRMSRATHTLSEVPTLLQERIPGLTRTSCI